LLATALVHNGEAIAQGILLSVGSHALTAQFVATAESNIDGGISAPSILMVNPTVSAMTLSVDSANPSIDRPMSLRAKVVPRGPQADGTSAPLGMVQFFAGPVLLGEAMVGPHGVVTLTTKPSFSATISTITSVYIGDANYLGATSPAVNVGAAPTQPGGPTTPGPVRVHATTTTLIPRTIRVTGRYTTVRLTAVVVNDSGLVVDVGNVTFRGPEGRGPTLGLINGRAEVTIVMRNRPHLFATATFNGIPTLKASTTGRVKIPPKANPAKVVSRVAPRGPLSKKH